MNLSFQPPEQDDPRDDDERMREVDKTPFELWHYANGNNTQGIPWVDKLVKAAWDAGANQTTHGWRTMETAPKFSDEIDIWASGMRFTYCAYGKPTYGKELGWIYESHRDSDGPVYEIVKNPTHWMPLPSAPEVMDTNDNT